MESLEAPETLRTVEIRPPSARAETGNVLRAAALIVLATWIYLADTAGPWPAAGSPAGSAAPDAARAGGAPPAAGDAAARDLMPYQRLFRTLDSAGQRSFRELQEGLLEAENARSHSGRWPPPAALAARGIPPFADAAGPRRGAYRWQLRQDGWIVNYLGTAAAQGDPALLLLIQEPDPSAPADPAAPAAGSPAAATDEVHHRLADGAVLHVSIWMRTGRLPDSAAAAATVIAAPYNEGWTQLLVGDSAR